MSLVTNARLFALLSLLLKERLLLLYLIDLFEKLLIALAHPFLVLLCLEHLFQLLELGLFGFLHFARDLKQENKRDKQHGEIEPLVVAV